ncbi:hypothetical protein TVAG_173070 [Trichomonas vaginalis G3]|uniref:Uncharacterized protein n=1 Tax=Trichomonas vaginalis (strain ATCC PRA-98 / G3) TaxID=412133 RepID=A2DF57_TRIV3|nr:hypothetical protein TVAGG3_0532180 [Trichomonas vaginalis G3]EAY21049.1 hypothetical protein TVAG_173070 [Trichomonas vaginalis G3]KAI5519233.1 hypothetical protein TVAGG3_0532180 [Trichomonas vaginalis G3]|eukprot:XP_001582035.1 hypothetical protein [Trichomonas vaginalis G3]
MYSHSSSFSSQFKQVSFEKFQSSAVVLDQGILEMQTFYNFTFGEVQEDMTFIRCTFKMILNPDNKYSAIYIKTTTSSSFNIYITECAFAQVFGSVWGPILFSGSTGYINKTCFTVCYGGDKAQSYVLKCSQMANCTEIVRHATSPKKIPGQSHADQLEGERVCETYLNQSFSGVSSRAACVAIGRNARYLNFQYVAFVNISGMNFMVIDCDNLKEYKIAYGYMYKCIYHVESSSLLECHFRLKFENWDFIQTKMLFVVISQFGTTRSVDGMQFINCRTDVPKQKQIIPNDKWNFSNFTIISRQKYIDYGPDFDEWLCQTDVPPSPAPTPERSPLPTHTATAMPLMTVPVFEVKQQDAPELIDPDHMPENNKGFTTADYIQIAGLVVLIIITGIVFFLAMKKKKKQAPNPDEEEQLLQY